MLTVFANIRINDPERLQHMKDSFYSFRSISDNWVINVRGSQRQQAVDFLKKELGNQITLFELLDDKRGWIQNTLKMLPSVKYDYMLVWNEDHICLAEPDEIKGVVNEMKDHNVVYLPYTWWFFGKIKKGLEALPFNHARFIDHVTLSSDDWKKATDKGYPYGLIALCGIFKVTFFKQLMLLDKYKLPLFLTTNFYRFATVLNKIGISFNQRKAFNTVNKLLFHKLRRYSKETPFDLEKDRSRTEILPLKVAWPKKELFACIDDELKCDGVSGYQLIKRGLYPKPSTPQSKLLKTSEINEIFEKNNDYEITNLNLLKDNSYNKVFYEDAVRIEVPMKQTVVVLSGKISVKNLVGEVVLYNGQASTFYTHIHHEITALEDAHIILISPSTLNKKIEHISQTISMLNENTNTILSEINKVLSGIDEAQIEPLISAIIKAKKIVTVGAGRVGLATKAFTQRLGHFGLEAYHLGDSTVPHIGEGDLLLACSGSGETQTVFDIVDIAKKNNAKIALLTGNKDSRIGNLADVIVEVKAPSKTKAVEGLISIQPMTTLNEQCLYIFFDSLVLSLMDKLNESHETMWGRHSNLE
ncbi:SIS domain-containing protein [Patescibacteria group bacterium]|nr:SIS domain-containing protein [Patescibacteria group bacterium]